MLRIAQYLWWWLAQRSGGWGESAGCNWGSFFPLGWIVVSYLSPFNLMCKRSIANCDVCENRHSSPLPAFPGGSQTRGSAGPQDRCHPTCVYTDSGVVRLSGKLGCVFQHRVSCGGSGHAFIHLGAGQHCGDRKTGPPKQKKPSCPEPLSFSTLGSPLLPVQAKRPFSSHPAVLLLRGRGSCLADWPPCLHCNPLLESSRDQRLSGSHLQARRWSRSRPSLIRTCQGCQGNC